MKRVFSLVAILAIIFASNCSRIPENNDPVIGIWYKTEENTLSSTEKISLRKEWIFNDVYLGRYHRYEGNSLAFKTDYKWERNGDLYTISYPGTDMPPAVVRMKEGPDGVTLEDEKGVVLATRE